MKNNLQYLLTPNLGLIGNSENIDSLCKRSQDLCAISYKNDIIQVESRQRAKNKPVPNTDESLHSFIQNFAKQHESF